MVSLSSRIKLTLEHVYYINNTVNFNKCFWGKDISLSFNLIIVLTKPVKAKIT